MKTTELKLTYFQKVLSEPINNSKDCFDFFIRIWDKELINIQEQAYVIYLNRQNEVICWKCLCTGTCCETLFDVKLAMACALSCMSTKIVIAHNHPSGSLTPSMEDILYEKKLAHAADTMSIELIDYIIIAGDKYSTI